MPVDQPMRWVTEVQSPKPLRFMIENDLVMGFFLIVYENGHRINDLKDRQYWFDTLEQAEEFVLKKFQVPLNSWTVAG